MINLLRWQFVIRILASLSLSRSHQTHTQMTGCSIIRSLHINFYHRIIISNATNAYIMPPSSNGQCRSEGEEKVGEKS